MSQPPSNEVIVERIDQLRAAMDRRDQDAAQRIDRLDQSINGRFGRIEHRVSDLELANAREQGAQQALEHATPAKPAAPDEPREVAWVKPLVGVLGALATLLGAIALLLHGGPTP